MENQFDPARGHNFIGTNDCKKTDPMDVAQKQPRMCISNSPREVDLFGVELIHRKLGAS